MKTIAILLASALFLNRDSSTASKEICVYAAACITNELDCTVNYTYRWGNNTWQVTSIPANMSDTHTYAYTGSSRSSPELYVCFDSSLSTTISYKEYCLERYQSWTTDCCDARKFSFQKVNPYSDSFDLYSLRD